MLHTHKLPPHLDRCLVSYRYDVLWLVLLEVDNVCLTGLCGDALELLGLASLLCLLLLGEVGLDALEEVLSRAGVADVLDSDVDALLHVAVADLLLENDADSRLGDVVDNASLAVVDLVGHTLLDRTCTIVSPAHTRISLCGVFRTVCYDIDDITDLVLLEVGRERDLEGC